MQSSPLFTHLKTRPSVSDSLGQQIAWIASGASILMGCLVVIGWKLDLTLIKSGMSEFATIKVNTAVCFILAGISLMIQTRKQQSSLTGRIAKGCAIAVSAIGLLTLCQYIFGWHLGIDELLVPDRFSVATAHPGRMGINTAINFSLTGVALCLLARRSPHRGHRVKVDRYTIAHSLVVVMGFITLQALVGYAYNVQVLYQLSVLTTSMALGTALTFGILSVGMLALHRDRGLMGSLTSDLLGSEVARRFIPVAILAPFLVGWLILWGLRTNLYDPSYALSLMSMSMIAIWLGLIKQNSGILNRMDQDRIRSAERIRSSEERLQLALSGSKQGIWEFDIQTQVLTWDDHCKAMFGLSPDTVVTEAGYLDAIHPDDRQRVTAAAEIALDGCGEFAQEYRTIWANGTVRWILAQGQCYCDVTGQPDRMSGTIMDITDRKQYQVTIQQQLGEIEAIYRSAPIGLSLIDTDFKFVRINEQLAQINGLSVSAHIGRTIREVLPEMAETIEPLYQQVIDSGEPILDLEVSGIVDSQPGVERSWLASYYPHKDADNRAIGVNATVQEITNRKRMEMARLAAEQERDRFFNLSLDLLAIGNFEGYFVRLNPAFEQILGFTNSELMAQPLINFVHPDDREHTLTGTRSLTLGDLVMDFENRYLCKNGSYRWVSWNARPYLQSNAWYAIGRDITERKQTKTALEERNQELDSFVHIVAHDLKAPLRGISNLSQWIEDDLEGQLLAANQPQMTLLRSRVRRMEAIVDGLLDYARVGKVAVKIEPVIVAELLAETIDSIAPPPTFKVIIDPNLPTLHTKRLLLFQVFANLIGNGIKHHDRLDGSLHISAAERSDCYEFRITDDGPGIALDYQDKIFKIFQSGNPQNKQDSSGIGLSIVKKIVETEGGSIWLQSQLGQGTTFYFTWQKCSDSDRNW